MKNRIFTFLIVIITSCNTFEEGRPLKGIFGTLEKGGVKERDIKLIVLPTDSGHYYLTDDRKIIKELVHGFSVKQDRECLKLLEERQNWSEFSLEPIPHKEFFLQGDIIFKTKDQERLSLIGFFYCKGSKTNSQDFTNRMSRAERIDTSFQEREANKFLAFLAESKDLKLRKKFSRVNDSIVDISYYRIKKTPYNNS
ncbi:hypothetical protein [Rufibacter roseus]|uniref:Lipoprotein n=1 Tax=Rufibacter roseus TaxID=1567108 RepID=A0ABW2DTF9_9BACT|nr:hypothetical protein [Rufibacter roseus]